jgi:hypothetical protein
MNHSMCWALAALLALPAAVPAQQGKPKDDQADNDPGLVALLEQFNGGLRAEWMDIRGEQIELLSAKKPRRGGRLHLQPSRWVEGDPRRAGGGTGLSYLFDTPDLLPPGGLSTEQAELALEQAVATWTGDECLAGIAVTRHPVDGSDPDLFDSLFGYGTLGSYPTADVVFAGWLPASFFSAVTPPDGGDAVIALAVTFVFVGPDSVPTDIDQDGFFDTALTEVYFNDRFAWTVAGEPGTIDLETVSVHELGHALGLGHDQSASSVMNPAYEGVRRQLGARDKAALCSVWSRWR